MFFSDEKFVNFLNNSVLKIKDSNTFFLMTDFTEIYAGVEEDLVCDQLYSDAEINEWKKNLIYCLSGEK